MTPLQISIITKTCLFKYIENFTSKKWKFSDINSNIFHISAQNIDCGYSLEPPRRGGSNEYLQSMFLSRNKKNNVYPCKPQFYFTCIKVGLRGSKLYRYVFMMWCTKGTEQRYGAPMNYDRCGNHIDKCTVKPTVRRQYSLEHIISDSFCRLADDYIAARPYCKSIAKLWSLCS